MESSVSGIVRFVVNTDYGLLFEVGEQTASASLAARYHLELGCDPDCERSAVAGVTFDLGEERGVCVARSPGVEATNNAIGLLTKKYGPMKRLNRPPLEQTRKGVSGIDWTTDLIRENYDPLAVLAWPLTSSHPVRDLIVLEHQDQLTFVHRSRRSGEPSPPATTLDDALTFASEARSFEWIEKHASAQRYDLVLRYRSVALARVDQSDAEVNEGMRE